MIDADHVLGVITKHERKLRRQNGLEKDDLIWLSFNPSDLEGMIEVAKKHKTHTLILDGDGRVSPGNFYVSARRIDYLIAEDDDEEGDQWKTSVKS